MYLDSSTKIIEVYLGEAIAVTNPVFEVSYNDHTTTTLTPGDSYGTLNGVTPVTIVSGTTSGARQITTLSIFNSDTENHTITVQKDVSSTDYPIISATIQQHESLSWSAQNSWRVIDSVGRIRKVVPASTVGISGHSSFFLKPGTGADSAAYYYSFGKDAGFPGAWAPGTPGVAGRATDGNDAADAGCLIIPNPSLSTSRKYLTNFCINTSLVNFFMVYDILWVNSGLVVTTTTAQNVNSVALPPRDNNGSTNGEGVLIGLLATATLGNAGAVSNSTISYTNSDGTAGRTATLLALGGANIPATSLIGTVVWFSLAAGDKGVRSIQTITLATTLTSGTISLIMARPLACTTGVTTGTGSQINPCEMEPGVPLYNGTCATILQIASTATATTVQGNITVMER